MNHSYLSSMVGLIMIGAGLFVSAGLIAELANAKMYKNTHKRALVKAKKLDVNNDGLISLDELTSRQNRGFQELDLEEDSQIDEADFNARLVAMFNRMDSNSDGMLDDVEISKIKHRHHSKDHDSRGLHKRWLYGVGQGGKQNKNGLPGPASLYTHYLPIRCQ